MHDDNVGAPGAAEPIGLQEIVQALAMRKSWLLASVVGAIVLALAYLILATPIYQARVAFRIGQVGGSGLFEPPEVLASRLVANFGREIADGVTRERPFLKRAVALSSVPAVVELVSEAYSPGDAVAFLQHVFSEVKEAHEALYSKNREVLVEQVRNIDRQKQEFEEQYATATAALESLKKAGDSMQASVLVVERSRVAGSITGLNAEKPNAALRLVPPQTQPTALLGEIAAPIRPVSPRRSIVLATAAVLGLLLGIALAFIVAFKDRGHARALAP